MRDGKSRLQSYLFNQNVHKLFNNYSQEGGCTYDPHGKEIG